MTKRQTGRPKSDLTIRVQIRLRPEEAVRFQKAAAADGRTLSSWFRGLGLKAVRS